MNGSSRKQILIAALGVGWTLTGIPANASCWADPHVAQLVHRIARQGFPNAAARMPDVIVCDSQHFGPGVGGDYTSGVHRIRLPVWQFDAGVLNGVLAHELAHAEVALVHGGEDQGRHSRHFFAALMRAGYHGEAERVAQYVAGGQRELHAARSALGARDGYTPPPAGGEQRWVKICDRVPVTVRFVLPDGRICIQRVIQMRCRLVPG